MGHRPRRHTPRPPPSLPASLHERNIAPAGHSTAWLTSSVKEKSPPLTQNWRKTALSRMQGRKIFHRTPQHLRQGRFFFHPSPIHTPQARINSPCSPPSAPMREKVRPAHAKHPKIGLFRLLGELFRGLAHNPLLLGEFFAPMWPEPTHNTCRPPCLKPMTPMRVAHCLEMKPLAPLRVPFRTRFHPRQALRPQPKPCVACTHATTPVAHWPHD